MVIIGVYLFGNRDLLSIYDVLGFEFLYVFVIGLIFKWWYVFEFFGFGFFSIFFLGIFYKVIGL